MYILIEFDTYLQFMYLVLYHESGARARDITENGMNGVELRFAFHLKCWHIFKISVQILSKSFVESTSHVINQIEGFLSWASDF